MTIIEKREHTRIITISAAKYIKIDDCWYKYDAERERDGMFKGGYKLALKEVGVLLDYIEEMR